MVKEFNWKGVDLNLLVAFQALYQTNSVSAAAEQCFVSQSAMSHTLQRMRTLFDDPLFERVGASMQPTRHAQEIAPVIDKLLGSIKNDLLVKKHFTDVFTDTFHRFDSGILFRIAWRSVWGS